MCYSMWYNAPTMLTAGSLEAELRHTGLLTACEQEHLLLLTIARNILSKFELLINRYYCI